MKLLNAYHLAEYGAAKCALLNLQQEFMDINPSAPRTADAPVGPTTPPAPEARSVDRSDS
jgi:hypothetical protein